MAKYETTIVNNLQSNTNVNVSGEQEIARLKSELQESKKEVDRLNSSLAYTKDRLAEVTAEYERFSQGNGLEIIRAELDAFRDTAKQAAQEFSVFLESVNLKKVGSSTELSEFANLFQSIREGSMTASQAIVAVKTNYRELLEESYKSGNGLFDQQMIQQFTASLTNLEKTMDAVLGKIIQMERDGVKAIGDAGTGGTGGLDLLFERIQTAAASMSEETKAAYGSITGLFSAMNELTSVDDTKLIGISQSFKAIADIGNGSVGSAKVENILNLARGLKELSASGISSFRIDLSNLQNVKISKTLGYLPEYLKPLSTLNVDRLHQLSTVNFSNFASLKVNKADLKNITEMTVAIKELMSELQKSVNAEEKKKTSTEDAAQKQYNDTLRQTIDLMARLDEAKRKYIPESGAQTSDQKNLLEQAKAVDELFRQYKNHEISLEEYNKRMSALRMQISETTRALKEYSAQQKKNDADNAQNNKNLKQGEDLLKRITEAADKYSKSMNASNKGQIEDLSKYAIEVQKAMDAFKSDGNLDEFKNKLADIESRFKSTSKELDKMSSSHRGVFGSLANDIKRYASYYLSFYMIIRRVTQEIRQMINTAVELDSAMTQLKIVTRDTASAYTRYEDAIAKTSREMGVSMKDMIDATTTYARLGYSLDESSLLAKYTTMLQKVGDIDSTAAQNAITSIHGENGNNVPA